MESTTKKTEFSNVNPFDLGSVGRITKNQSSNKLNSPRSSDVYSAGGENTSS